MNEDSMQFPWLSRRTDVTPLPGSGGDIQAGMKNYVIVLEKKAESQAPVDRRRFYDEGISEVRAFLERLESWLRENDLSAGVARTLPPTPFGAVGIVCTPKVAEKIKTLPEVESVFQDVADIKIL